VYIIAIHVGKQAVRLVRQISDDKMRKSVSPRLRQQRNSIGIQIAQGCEKMLCEIKGKRIGGRMFQEAVCACSNGESTLPVEGETLMTAARLTAARLFGSYPKSVIEVESR
jgi:hypothetical protein